MKWNKTKSNCTIRVGVLVSWHFCCCCFPFHFFWCVRMCEFVCIYFCWWACEYWVIVVGKIQLPCEHAFQMLLFIFIECVRMLFLSFSLPCYVFLTFLRGILLEIRRRRSRRWIKKQPAYYYSNVSLCACTMILQWADVRMNESHATTCT